MMTHLERLPAVPEGSAATQESTSPQSSAELVESADGKVSAQGSGDGSAQRAAQPDESLAFTCADAATAPPGKAGSDSGIVLEDGTIGTGVEPCETCMSC